MKSYMTLFRILGAIFFVINNVVFFHLLTPSAWHWLDGWQLMGLTISSIFTLVLAVMVRIDILKKQQDSKKDGDR